MAREREFGTFDQLLVAPFTPGEILIGKSLPGMCLRSDGRPAFRRGRGLLVRRAVPRKHCRPGRDLYCFITTMVGVGLLVSSLSMTMQQALLGSFVFMMPAVILSGFTTPIENMPHWLQVGTYGNPVRYVIAALRLIFLEGADISRIWPQLWPMLTMAAITLPLAAWLFRHRSR